MKKFTNKYIFIYSTILVVVVAVILTVVSLSLKPYQQKNQENENKQLILGAIGVLCERNEAADLYAQYITEEEQDGIGYYSFKTESQEGYIIPFDGVGLQDSIFAFLALDKQLNVIGVKFNHRAETPGLGAKMVEPFFAERFVGKSVVDGNAIVPIQVKKNAADSPYEVDAISGGTRTSEGVNNMFVDGITGKYFNLLNSLCFSHQTEEQADPDGELTIELEEEGGNA